MTLESPVCTLSTPLGAPDHKRLCEFRVYRAAQRSLMTLESPVSTLSTPLGTPARRASSASAKAVSGVDSAGFRMTCAGSRSPHWILGQCSLLRN